MIVILGGIIKVCGVLRMIFVVYSEIKDEVNFMGGCNRIFIL